MPPVAATATTLAALAVIYMGVCLARPFAECRRCEGAGRRTRRVLGGTRTCRACHGEGTRIRAGARLLAIAIRRYRGYRSVRRAAERRAS